jgi:hypothetical protein
MKPNRRSTHHSHPWPFATVALALGLQSSSSSGAALGDDVAAVAAYQARTRASLQTRRKSNYEIHELTLPTGTKIRHFVGDSGKVFAVSWSGGWRPNLRDVMGEHYDNFIATTRGKRVARRVARIELPAKVVVMDGHQRAFFGHVYLTDLSPAGFVSDISQDSHD